MFINMSSTYRDRLVVPHSSDRFQVAFFGSREPDYRPLSRWSSTTTFSNGSPRRSRWRREQARRHPPPYRVLGRIRASIEVPGSGSTAVARFGVRSPMPARLAERRLQRLPLGVRNGLPFLNGVPIFPNAVPKPAPWPWCSLVSVCSPRCVDSDARSAPMIGCSGAGGGRSLALRTDA